MGYVIKNIRKYILTFQLLFYFIIIGMIYFWITFKTAYDIFSPFGFGADLSNFVHLPLSTSTRILAFIVSLIPCIIILYGLRQLICLFKQYEKNNIFTRENTHRYKKLSYTLFAWVISQPVYCALISLVLSINNPPGHRVISISLGAIDVVALISGTIVLLIASVMDEAHKISDESKLTI